MPLWTFVTGSHPLSRFYNHHRLYQGGKNVHSIECGFWYALLIQHDRRDLARKLLQQQHLALHPANISNWIKQEGFRALTSWTYSAANLYYTALVHQMTQEDSLFRAAFLFELSRPPVGETHKFIATTNRSDRVWSSGIRRGYRDDDYPGLNIYGKMLDHLERSYQTGSYGMQWTVEQLHTEIVPIAEMRPRSVLVLSDSQCRYIRRIDDGKIVSISGGTYRDIAAKLEHLRDRGLRVSNFNIIIINGGINDCQKDERTQRKSWSTLKPLLLRIAERPYCAVIVCPEFPHPEVPASVSHARWINRELRDTPVKCVDWDRMPNPFVRHRRIVPKYFANDGFHLSPAGLSQLWKIWCEMSNYLRFVPYHLATYPYTVPRNRGLW